MWKELGVSFGSVGTETDEDTEAPLSPATGLPQRVLKPYSFTACELRMLWKECRTRSTDNFVSTCDNMDDLEETFTKEPPQQPIYEFEEEPKMSNNKPTADEVNVDAAAHIYGGVKNVWGWGKKQIIISTFLGITECVAGKVVGVVGTDLEGIDGGVKPKLADIDSSILNPAVRAILGIVLTVAGKSEDIFKPIVVAILKPIGLIKDGP